MIIVRLTSGLGNQLFQYAAGLALASVKNVPLAIDTRWFADGHHRARHEQLGLRAYVSSWREPTERELCWVRGRPRTWRGRLCIAARRLGCVAARGTEMRHVRYARDGDFSFDPGFFDLPSDTYLDGNWQSERYFAPVAEEVRALFGTYTPPREIAILAENIRKTPSAFVHVRRGDYVSDAHFAKEIGALSATYYIDAVSALHHAVGGPWLYVFTDDEEWVRRRLPFAQSATIIPPSLVTAPQDVLFLMSRCDHAVMANSSLSWWGAWLIEKPDPFVTAPAPWFAASWRNTRDLLPHRWRIFPRE